MRCYTTLWETFISTFQAAALSPLWLLSFTGCYIMRVSRLGETLKILRISRKHNRGLCRHDWKGQINKAAAAMATLMSPSLMAWHDSLVVLRCHRHVSEDPSRCYSCVKWTSRRQRHFINDLHEDLIKRRLLSDIKRNWNELYFGRNAFPSSLLGPLQKSHLGIPTNNAPPLLSSKFTDLSCNACRNTVHFLLCRKIPFCSTDVLLPVCWGSAQPYVIYWAWLHCQCCFPTIINNYNAETSLIFIVHSLRFFSEMYFSSDSSRLGRCHIALCLGWQTFFFFGAIVEH